MAAPTIAQDEPEDIEEVIVSGVRSSLETSQDIKRNSDVVVDSVTAEDIGALPDRSVTETLQRVPGVAITRFAAGNDPDHFSVEGSGVVVRGLTFVRSEVNGRDSFTANNGRGLSFADVPAELLGGVDVFKSPSADRIEGGIAGSVNLRTRKPFDSTEESVYALSLEGNYSDLIEESSPTISGLFSRRWENDAGQWGFLASGVFSEVRSRGDRFQVSNFAERDLFANGDVVPDSDTDQPVGTVIFPRGAVMGSQEFDRERRGASAAFQWRSPDESLEATFQFLRSDGREAWTERVVEIATDVVGSNGDSRALAGTSFGFDGSGVFDNGTITGPTGWRADQFTDDPRTPINGLQSNNINRSVNQRFVTDDYGLNLTWYLSEATALNFDYQHVDSTVENIDVSLWTASYQNASINLNGNDVPTVEFLNPEACNDAPSNECPTYFGAGNDSYQDPFNYFYRAAMDHIEDSDGQSDAFRLDVDHQFDSDGWLGSLQAGYRFANRDQTARFSRFNWGVLSEQWGNDGPQWLDESVAGGQPLDIFEPFFFDNFFAGDAANPIAGQGRLFYRFNGADDYAQTIANARAINQAWDPSGGGWVPLAQRADAIDGTPFTRGEINPVEETNNAAYFQVKFGNELANGWNLSGNVGVRYTETEREASGFETFQLNQSLASDEECAEAASMGLELSPFCGLSPEVRADARAFSDGAVTSIVEDLTYDYFLPSVNLRLEVGGGLQFRAAYFKGVSAPDFGLTRVFSPVSLQFSADDIAAGGGRPVARFNAGNPLLEPVESDNIDLTAEWYFSEVGQLSLALFYKELDGIRTNDIERRTFTNNGATFEGIVTTPINSTSTGRIKGAELSYQQTFDNLPGWMSGFGVQANYTYVDSSNVPQSILSNSDPDVGAGNQSTVDISQLPLEGLSENTLNITPFWEYDNWSARLAYSWRDDYLLTIRDVIVPFQPILQRSSGQLDGSIFYQVSDNWRVGVQGVNLLQETIQTQAIVNDDLQTVPRSWFINDRRFTLIARAQF